jgi:hypothetical protein
MAKFVYAKRIDEAARSLPSHEPGLTNVESRASEGTEPSHLANDVDLLEAPIERRSRPAISTIESTSPLPSSPRRLIEADAICQDVMHAVLEAQRCHESHLHDIAAVIANASLVRSPDDLGDSNQILASLVGRSEDIEAAIAENIDAAIARRRAAGQPVVSLSPAPRWWAEHCRSLVIEEFTTAGDDRSLGNRMAGEKLKIFIHAYLPDASRPDSFWLGQAQIARFAEPAVFKPQFFSSARAPAFNDTAWGVLTPSASRTIQSPIPAVSFPAGALLSASQEWVAQIAEVMRYAHSRALDTGYKWRDAVASAVYNFMAINGNPSNIPRYEYIEQTVADLTPGSTTCPLFRETFYNQWPAIGSAQQFSTDAQQWAGAMRRLLVNVIDLNADTREHVAAVEVCSRKVLDFVNHHLPSIKHICTIPFLSDQIYLFCDATRPDIYLLHPKLFSTVGAYNLNPSLRPSPVDVNSCSLNLSTRLQNFVVHPEFYCHQLLRRNLPRPSHSNYWQHALTVGLPNDVPLGPWFDPNHHTHADARRRHNGGGLAAFHAWQARGLTGPASSAWDPEFYIAQNADVAALVSTARPFERALFALEHWQQLGIPRGRAGSATFHSFS